MPRRVIDMPEPGRRTGGLPLRPEARRQRVHRARAHNGRIVLRVEVDHLRLITAISKHGALSEAETLSRSRVEQVAAQMIDEVIALYL
jgi:hypothetical protein